MRYERERTEPQSLERRPSTITWASWPARKGRGAPSVRYSDDRTMIRESLAIVALTLILTACSKPQAVVVGSMDGTEQRLLGEIVAQHLSKRLEGVEIQRRFGAGDTPILYQAVLSGQVDLYPEYSGSILAEILKEDVPKDPAVVLERARIEVARMARLDLLSPLGFDARYVAVAPSAATPGVSTLSQAASGKTEWNLGIPLEFQARSDGLPSLNAYHLTLAAAPRAMRPEQLFPALTRGDINMVVIPQTDSHLTEATWKILEDDQMVNSPQQAALLVSQDAIKKQPKLRAALEELSGKLSVETMRRMNAEVDLKERPAAEVAAEFLKASGL